MQNLIKVLGSGSDGNCLAIYNSRGKCILLDVGLPYKAILKGLNYKIDDLLSVFVTHVHQDHSKAINDCIKYGITVYANEDVCKLYPKCNVIDSILVYHDDDFTVKTFGVVHNVDCNAFVVDTCDNIRILYATDAKFIPCTVKNVDYAIIECNYSDDDIIESMVDGVEIRSHYYQHHSLDNCIDYLRHINNPDMKAVILWHASSTNLDKDKACQSVQDAISLKNVYMAKKGLEIEICKYEF